MRLEHWHVHNSEHLRCRSLTHLYCYPHTVFATSATSVIFFHWSLLLAHQLPVDQKAVPNLPLSNLVPVRGAAESALGAHGQLLERREARGLVNARDDRFLVFKCGYLR
jgi:hypothetical protein